MFQMIFSPALLHAATVPGYYGQANLPAPVANALPQLQSIVEGISRIEEEIAGQLVVHQEASKAIADWETFNIGRDASVIFDQQGNANWTALNRIHDQNPSQILGRLTADGKVYLVNPSGILFGQDSRVDVHGLVASSLSIAREDFLNNRLIFTMDSEEEDSSGAYVSNHGAIRTDELGSVFLIAPNVENYGDISTPAGQTGLAAGEHVSLYPNESSSNTRTALVVRVSENPGIVHNGDTGRIAADTGLAGMYGRRITQDGLVQSMTAVKRNGSIELLATEQVITGENSTTETPVSESSEAVHESFTVQEGSIIIDGLDPDNPQNPQTPVEKISIGGVVSAPSGMVVLKASERVLVDSGSTIDVAGEWAETNATDMLVTAQLNSVELRDDYGQKDGDLFGEAITVNPLEGSSIGDLSNHLASRETTALERSTDGGIIEIRSRNGDVVVKEGARIDFSGGGTHVLDGTVNTTRLMIGNSIVDISDAPQWAAGAEAMGYQKVVSERYGTVEEFEGIYTGGGVPIQSASPYYLEGDDAGTLKLIAKRIVLDGRLDGSVTMGDYQVLEEEEKNDNGEVKTRGLAMPSGGALVIGGDPAGNTESVDMVTDAVIVTANPEKLPAGYSMSDSLPSAPFSSTVSDDASVISSDILNRAGLDTLKIYSNLGVAIAEGVNLKLNTEGTFLSETRFFSNAGSITAPSGSIYVTISDNKTSFVDNDAYHDIDNSLILANGGVFSVTGDIREMSLLLTPEEITPAAQVDGGDISLTDETRDGDYLYIAPDALVDVSGGYAFDASGNVTSGSGGSLTLEGNTLRIDGTLLGRGAGSAEGGSLRVHSETIRLETAESMVPETETPAGGIVLRDDFLNGSGFSNVTLRSVYNLETGAGITLSPSYDKVNIPTPGDISAMPGASPVESNRISTLTASASNASAETLESSSIQLEAGSVITESQEGDSRVDQAAVTIGGTSRIGVLPEGSIRVKGPLVVIGGELTAPAGDIHISTDSGGDLLLSDTARLTTAGYNLPEPSVFGNSETARTPLSGGNITLHSDGALTIASGSSIDVRGSAPIERHVADASGTVSAVRVAGNAGRVRLSALEEIHLDGQLYAASGLPSVPGGSLTIESRNPDASYTVEAASLTQLIDSGFDYLTLASFSGLSFTEMLDITMGRKLILDAPEITLSDSPQVRFAAPWVVLQNTYWPLNAAAPDAGGGQVTLSGDWVDINGGVLISGIDSTRIQADRAIRFSDALYELNGVSKWAGNLSTAGELNLESPLTYVATLSNVDIDAAGKVAIQGKEGMNTSPAMSAGGNLTLRGSDILIEDAVVAAPSGTIAFEATGENGRIQVAEGAVLTTRGENDVKYGSLDETNWYLYNKADGETDQTLPVTDPPRSGITLAGNEIVMEEGATMNVSGGGSIFAYQFLPGVEGSGNPLSVPGRYVIRPDHPLAEPGPSLYLDGIDGLPAGYYTLLPESYAFAEGALILQQVGGSVSTGGPAASVEGYPVTTGYKAYSGVSGHESEVCYFSVRSAQSVLEEGYFNVETETTGDAGDLTVAGKTTVLQGDISGNGMDGFSGGSLTLSAGEITVGGETVSSMDNIAFHEAIPDALENRLFIDTNAISGSGMESLTLGAADETSSVTIAGNTALDISTLSIHASDRVEIGENASISSPDGGTLLVNARTGEFSLSQGALIQGQDTMDLRLGGIDLEGVIALEDVDLTLSGSSIYLAADGTDLSDVDGLILKENFWREFEKTSSLTFAAENGLYAAGNVSIAAKEGIHIDTPGIAAWRYGPGDFEMVSNSISLLNGGDGIFARGRMLTGGAISISSEKVMGIGWGDIAVDGYSTAAFSSGEEIRFMGSGSLETDGDLMLTSRSVTTGLAYAGDRYDAADFTITAKGVLSLNGVQDGGSPGGGNGGKLTFTARTIQQTGVLNVSGGHLALNATGSSPDGNVILGNGAMILAGGTANAPGGAVSLTSKSGAVLFEDGAVIDVSAGFLGDAGSVSISAFGEGAEVDGTLLGASGGGNGGAFSLETNEITPEEIAVLSKRLAEGGFNHEVDMATATGDIFISSNTSISADSIRFSADAGSIRLDGMLSSEDADGIISLFGGTGVTLETGAVMYHGNTDGSGGSPDVLLSSRNGSVFLDSESRIVFESPDETGGGVLYIRAPATDNGKDAAVRLNGKVAGADVITVEAVTAYDAADVDTDVITAVAADMNAFNDAAAGIARTVSGAGNTGDAGLDMIPGAEIRHEGDIAISDDIDLDELSKSGAITILAAGDLLVNGNVESAFESEDPDATGWNITLAAGADLSAADPMSTHAAGNLTMRDGNYIYSERGYIQIATGGDVSLTGLKTGYFSTGKVTSYYSIGTESGDISGNISGDLLMDGAAIQSATGNINLSIGGDLVLAKENGLSGAVRTYGHFDGSNSGSYWSYSGGGDIHIDVGGNITSVVNKNAWDRAYTVILRDEQGNRYTETHWAASYTSGDNEEITQGIATMGGGDVTVHGSGDGYLTAGAFQEGNVSLHFGGDLDGRFLVSGGAGRFSAAGGFGQLTGSQVELLDAETRIHASGDMAIGAVVNPTTVRPGMYNGNDDWNLTYGRESGIHLSTDVGNILLSGSSPYYSLTSLESDRARVLPSNLSMVAGGNISIANRFVMAPSEKGRLDILAAGDIDGSYYDLKGNLKHGMIHMSDLDPEAVFGNYSNVRNSDGTIFNFLVYLFNPYGHSSSGLHKGDTAPINISAGGDIRDIKLSLAKSAVITAGNTIQDIQYLGQNTNDRDSSRIMAGGSIIFDPLYTKSLDLTFSPGIEQGGGGQLLIAAEENIDLGKSAGIATVGNQYNQALADQEGELDVVAGSTILLTPEEFSSFYTLLLEEGNKYSEHLAKGDKAAAREAVDAVRELIAETIADDPSGNTAGGNINMVYSKIYSSSENGTLRLLADGEINVGRSTFSEGDAAATGIYTTSGSDIGIFAGGDLNVNESKLMTYRGGSILVWSDRGDINAGRGSKTAISVDPPKVTINPDGTYVLVFNPPAVGSGIRTLTYDPDGAEGPESEPEAGDVYLFAPEGVIDAGEAGISGKKVVLAATEVLNAQNIDFALGSVGVPDAGGAGVSIGAMAGVGTVSEAAKMSEGSSLIGDSQDRLSNLSEALSDSLLARWITVEVIGFIDETESEETDEDN